MSDQIMPSDDVLNRDRHVNLPANVKSDFLVKTSLDTTSIVNRALVLELIEGPCDRADDAIGQPFELSDYICHAVELTDPETGEVTEAVRTLLLRPNGIPIGVVSTGVLRSLGRLGWVTGHEPPWDPPLKVRLVQQATKNGRRTFKLAPVKD